MYTLSFDASPKVQRGGVHGFVHHIGRDVDKENGVEVRHANQDIDAARTADNVTLVADGEGGWKPCEDTREIGRALDARLADVKKPLRKDAVVLRPLILQMDPEWYAAHPGPAERERVANTMLEWAAGQFGPENLIYVALHNDENAPHLHLGFSPVTDDGRLAQKDWFSSPKALREMHQDFRQHMTEAGYEIEMKNKKPGKHAKRMGEQEYKDFQDLQNEARKIETQQGQLTRWGERLHEREAALNDREKQNKDREAALEARERKAAEREKALEARERAQEAREATLRREGARVAYRGAEAALNASEAQTRAEKKAAAEAAALTAVDDALAAAARADQRPKQQEQQQGLSPV